MRVYFLRHSTAEDAAEIKDDFKRKLTAKGIRKMELAAPKMVNYQIKPAVIYTSPLVRAKQTAELVAPVLNAPVEETPLLQPGFNDVALQKLISRHQDEDIMVVGHEPDFSQTIGKIIGGGRVVMKKGGLARVDILVKVPLQGELAWLLTTRMME